MFALRTVKINIKQCVIFPAAAPCGLQVATSVSKEPEIILPGFMVLERN